MEKLKSFVIKTMTEESEHHFEGYASTFGNVDRDGDIMAKGCFDNTVKEKAVVPMCLNHHRDIIIGKMELSVDDKGLKTVGTFNLNDPEAVKVRDLMKMGAIDSFSIGFIVKDYEPIDPKMPYSGTTFKEVDVFEVSVVTVPANPQATVDVVKSQKKFEQKHMKQAIMKKLALI
ncbi:TPA: HK97 family phage prohead protease [Streptococcus suis]|nr:HK97 family phage prohead protease [Streptococcus suis]